MLQPVSEEIIDDVLQLTDSDSEWERCVNTFVQEQPVIDAYLDQEDLTVLTQEERAYLFCTALVVWESIGRVYSGRLPRIEMEELELTEEANVELLESQEGGWDAWTDEIIENHEQPAIMGFIVDSIAEDADEDMVISKESREVMFVTLKTVLDVLQHSVPSARDN